MRDHSGGPKINFRGGRIDAKQPDPTGVPQPQDSLQSHTAAFVRAGFSAVEMIQLVACGHTLGGVQSTCVALFCTPFLNC
jgi:catalase (peroxidase I)